MQSELPRSGVTDRTFGNATRRGLFQQRFMRTLSIGVKLWVTTGILALPLIGLGVFYVRSLSATVLFTGAEQQGAELFRPLAKISRDVSTRAETESGAAPASEDPSSNIDKNLAILAQLDAEHGNDATHAKLRDLQANWQALKASPHSSMQDVLDAHGAAIDSAFALKGQIGADWLLILDPELAAYDLIDVSLTKLPDAQRYLSELRVRLHFAAADGVYRPNEGYPITELIALLRDRLLASRDEIQGAADAAKDRPELAQQISAITRGWDVEALDWLTKLSAELSGEQPSAARLQELQAASVALSSSFDTVQDQVQQAADKALAIRYAGELNNAVFALTGSAFAMVLAVLLMLALAKRVSGAITRLLYISQQIADGNYENRIDTTGRDEISRLFAGMANMQCKLASQIMSERAQLVKTRRIQAGLDNVFGSVMVADANGEIIYTNGAMEELLRRAEVEIRKHVPGFSAAHVVGSSLQDLGLSHAQTSEVSMGALTFRLTVNAVVAENGERIGTVIEWVDRTVEISMERETEQMLAGVLQGNLARRIDVTGKSGFFNALARGMNQLADNIQQIVATTQSAAGSVQRGAEEISDGNTHLSQRTEAQAASLEKTASSMAQMTLTVKQNADSARQADLLATAACDQAQKGGQIVGQAVSAMSGISESSKQVASIIGVIDEIAFQTNLLALNAAVEAARAGEQGRGFAVVASEVRSLAGRSATAAKAIKELIQDSVKKVDDGALLVSQSGRTLEQIVVAVKKVNDMVAAIAMASEAQSSGIEQVNRAVREMDEMTHQNASLVEQATAASQAMAEQARELTELMGRYQTAGTVMPRRSQAA
jgi:methyl-accepting chemotaxis protein